MKSLNKFIREGMFDVEDAANDILTSMHFQQGIERILKKTSADNDSRRVEKCRLQLIDLIEKSGETCSVEDIAINEIYAAIPDIPKKEEEPLYFFCLGKSRYDSTLVTIGSFVGFVLTFQDAESIKFIEKKCIKTKYIKYDIYKIPLDDLSFMSKYDRY